MTASAPTVDKVRRRPRLAAAALALVALCCAACGVPTNQSAVMLPQNYKVAVVGEASSTTSTTTTTTLPRGKTPAQPSVFFFGPDGHLAEVHRPESKLVTPNVVLYLLALGPNAKEKTLTTLVPPSPNIDVAMPRTKGVADVYLDDASFGPLVGTQLYEALAQIVYTLMSDFPSITGIRFYLRIAGGMIPFNYTPDGNVVTAPVTTQTYASLAPLPPPKTPKTPRTAKKR